MTTLNANNTVNNIDIVVAATTNCSVVIVVNTTTDEVNKCYYLPEQGMKGNGVKCAVLTATHLIKEIADADYPIDLTLWVQSKAYEPISDIVNNTVLGESQITVNHDQEDNDDDFAKELFSEAYKFLHDIVRR